MFSWGEDHQLRLLLEDLRAEDGVRLADLSSGPRGPSFIHRDGRAFIVRKTEGTAGELKRLEHRQKFTAVRCGDDSITLLSERGVVFWVDMRLTPLNPQTPAGLANRTVSQVACGNRHSVVLTKDGQVYTWGQDSRGQLGLGRGAEDAISPQHLRCLSAQPLVLIAAGGEQSFALCVSGGVIGWGRNDRGQLGLGDRTDRRTPTAVDCLSRKRAVFISCGNDHTAVLTKLGAVFTFGSGQYGQLGHNSFKDELRPRIVAELWGAKVTNIACGRNHTLVLTASRKLYSFGRGEQGQLGRGADRHPSVPLPVQPPPGGEGLTIRRIYAGGNSSFAAGSSTQEVDDASNTDCVTPRSIDGMIDRWTSKCNSQSWKKMKKQIQSSFSSASCLNQSFLDRSNGKHFQTSRSFSGLDLSLAQLAFEKLAKKDSVLREVEAAVLQLLPSLDQNLSTAEGLRVFFLLIELLHVIQRRSRQQSTALAVAVAAAVGRLSVESLRVVGDWWSSLSPSTKVKHVKVWRKALSDILSSNPAPHKSGAQNLVLVLQYLYDTNSRISGCHRIPEETFRLELSRSFLSQDMFIWYMKKVQTLDVEPLVFPDFPFLMSLKSKTMAFELDAEVRKMVPYTKLWFQVPNGSDPQSSILELKLRRAKLWEDTSAQLAAVPHPSLRNALRVYLDEDPKVTDVYKRDFFQRLFHDIALARPETFLFNDSKTLVWFPSHATEKNKKSFFLLGVLCGLAMFNQSIIHFPFPLALFKKLLGLEPTLEDLKEFSSVGRSLQEVLGYEDDLLQNLYMVFSIMWDGTAVDLDPQNPGKPVTSENKKEFVDSYVKHVFNGSVEDVFQEFRRGFFLVCEEKLVKLFEPHELREVLLGKDVYDWAMLKKNTVCEPLYPVGLHTIQMFWEVFEELTEDQRKDFIFFLTGYRSVPVLGMGQIKMKIRTKLVEYGSPDKHYPESLTCHSILLLPSYSNKKIMKSRLTEALVQEWVFAM